MFPCVERKNDGEATYKFERSMAVLDDSPAQEQRDRSAVCCYCNTWIALGDISDVGGSLRKKRCSDSALHLLFP